jgi:hypothetical protein
MQKSDLILFDDHYYKPSFQDLRNLHALSNHDTLNKNHYIDEINLGLDNGQDDLVWSIANGVLFIGDPHARSKTPGRRRDIDFIDTIIGKMEQIVSIANEHHLQPICEGDLFDNALEHNIELINRLIHALKQFDKVMWCIYGNHDIDETTPKQHNAIKLLETAGVLKLLQYNGIFGAVKCINDEVINSEAELNNEVNGKENNHLDNSDLFDNPFEDTNESGNDDVGETAVQQNEDAKENTNGFNQGVTSESSKNIVIGGTPYGQPIPDNILPLVMTPIEYANEVLLLAEQEKNQKDPKRKKENEQETQDENISSQGEDVNKLLDQEITNAPAVPKKLINWCKKIIKGDESATQKWYEKLYSFKEVGKYQKKLIRTPEIDSEKHEYAEIDHFIVTRFKQAHQIHQIIWLTHHDLALGGHYPNALPVKEIIGVDMVINGHMHDTKKPVKVNYTVYYNTGNITRLSIDTINHKPAVWAFSPFHVAYEYGKRVGEGMASITAETVNELTPYYLTVQEGKDVFNLEGKENLTEEDLERMVENLEIKTEKVFAGLLEKHDVEKTNDGSLVKESLAHYLEEIENEKVRDYLLKISQTAIEEENV